MPRVKRGVGHVKKRQTLKKKVKGYKWGRKNWLRLAKTAATKAGVHSYIGRKKEKRVRRSLWQIKINSATRIQDLSYSKFINKLKAGKIELDRKILADLAENNPKILGKIIKELK
ncbi:MAG: 50S ribosomal protein L20 [Patescibacteria group bacterium]|nr:50S ribosomal protein L20 [Patescibacteria group bacterium]